MTYAYHIHPCHTARERNAAVRISTRVAMQRAEYTHDLVDDILLMLDNAGLEEARLSTADEVRQVSIEGRLWLTWYPVACERSARLPQDEADAAYTLKHAAMRFGYNEKTLHLYVKKGWLRGEVNGAGQVVISESAMRAFKAGLCKGTVTPAFRQRGYGPIRLRKRPPLLNRAKRRQVVVAGRSCLRTVNPVLREVRSAYPLVELVPLHLRRAQVLSRDSATGPLVRVNSPPGLSALAHAPP